MRKEKLLEVAKESARVLLCSQWRVMARVSFEVAPTQGVRIVELPVHRDGNKRVSHELYPAVEAGDDPSQIRLHTRLLSDEPPIYVVKQLLFDALLPIAMEELGVSEEELLKQRPQEAAQRAHKWLVHHGYPGIG